jgi:chloramphenicol O-acetyltransferase type A
MENGPQVERHVTQIDLDQWPRREQYELYRGMAFPYFGLTVDVDVGPLRAVLRERGASFTVGLVYVLARAANAVSPFRQRIRGDIVVEHEVVDPAITVLRPNELFSFCTLPYDAVFERFARTATKRIERARESGSLYASGVDHDGLYYMTSVPWLSFSGFLHPAPLRPPDSVPRIAWGRFAKQDGRVTMPLNIQVHHALVDGIHAARFYARVGELIEDAASIL